MSVLRSAGGLVVPGTDSGPGGGCPAVGNRIMSAPVSAVMTCAVVTPMPGIEQIRAQNEKGVALLKGHTAEGDAINLIA